MNHMNQKGFIEFKKALIISALLVLLAGVLFLIDIFYVKKKIQDNSLKNTPAITNQEPATNERL